MPFKESRWPIYTLIAFREGGIVSHAAVSVAHEPLIIKPALPSFLGQELLLFRSDSDRAAAEAALNTGGSRYRRVPYRHCKLESPRPLLAFAVANGFRNIQTVVRLLRLQHRSQALPSTTDSHKSKQPFPFDYVEVMACPKGTNDTLTPNVANESLENCMASS